MASWSGLSGLLESKPYDTVQVESTLLFSCSALIRVLQLACVNCFLNPMLSLDVRSFLRSCNFQLWCPLRATSHHIAARSSHALWPVLASVRWRRDPCATTKPCSLRSLVLRVIGLVPIHNSTHNSFHGAQARRAQKTHHTFSCLRSNASCLRFPRRSQYLTDRPFSVTVSLLPSAEGEAFPQRFSNGMNHIPLMRIVQEAAHDRGIIRKSVPQEQPDGELYLVPKVPCRNRK